MRGLIAAMMAVLTAAAPVGPSAEQRLAQAQVFVRENGERLWRGYGSAPFEALLIEPARETLLCRKTPPAGFAAAGRDAATGCPKATRSRSDLPADLLAAMPVFGLPPTIVMGSPAATGRTPGDWTRTILHEHFHQWQMMLPRYFERTKALGLAGADGSAMWMLNYPFPYDDATVTTRYDEAAHALADAIAARRTAGFGDAARKYLMARDRFAATAGTRNWRYFEFELWQEGVARWTEIALGRDYPDREVRATAAAMEARTIAGLRKPNLAKQQRDAVYYLGAGEAMVLEACDPAWRRRYPQLLALGPLFESVRQGCGRDAARP